MKGLILAANPHHAPSPAGGRRLSSRALFALQKAQRLLRVRRLRRRQGAQFGLLQSL